eukprot:542436_1
MNQRKIVIGCSSAIVGFIAYKIFQQLRNSGRYEIISIHKAKQYKHDVQQVIAKEWQSNTEINMDKILPTHLVLLHYKNINDNIATVIGQVSIGGRLGDPNYSGPSKWKSKTDPVLYITSLIVHPKYRGNGWGKTLMASIHKYTQIYNLKQKGVRTIEGQTASRKLVHFYSKLGGTISNSDLKLKQEMNIDVPHKKMYIDLNDNKLIITTNQMLTKQSKLFNLSLFF